MQPGKIDGATRSLGAPPDWDAHAHGECAALWIRDAVLNDVNVLQSAWTPSDEERRAIAAGAPIIFTVWSPSHPPVSIDVGPTP